MPKDISLERYRELVRSRSFIRHMGKVTKVVGLTIETVSRLLGHTNIKTTQIYAKITAQKISQDMETLSHKLEDMEKNICRAI